MLCQIVINSIMEQLFRNNTNGHILYILILIIEISLVLNNITSVRKCMSHLTL